ncbi:MAG: NlpC/P60 family protein [Acidimicrobiales bacterium]
MTYTDGLSNVLTQIGQIQGTFAALPPLGQPADFESVLDFVSSLAYVGGPVTSDPNTEPVGWPLEEGQPVSPQLGTASATASPAIYEAAESASAGPNIAGASAAPAGAEPLTGSELSFGQQVVADAEKYIGTPYLWGGTNPSQGVDCSGLVQDVFADLGTSLPRTSQEQARAGVPVASLADAQPGDLVFFPGTDGTAAAPGHVGIYIGNGEMIDAPYAGAKVRVDPVGDPTEIRRIIGPVGTVGTVSAVGTTGTAGAAGTTGTDVTAGMQDTTGTVAASLYASDFASASASTGVPQSLLAAVAETESANQSSAVSNAGAQGLMQLMPSTANSLGINPFNPAQAIPAAANLLSSYYKQFGSWSLALAAYNAGPAAVESSGGIPPYPETQAYVREVLSRAGMEPA